MATIWTDEKKNEWNARIDTGVAIKLKEERGIDLLDEGTAKALSEDPYLALELMIWVHRRQFEAKGIDDGDFAELATETPEVSAAATIATLNGLVNFCQRMNRPELAGILQAAMRQMDNARKKALGLLEKHADKLAAKAIDKEIAATESRILKALAE